MENVKIMREILGHPASDEFYLVTFIHLISHKLKSLYTLLSQKFLRKSGGNLENAINLFLEHQVDIEEKKR